MTRYKGTIKLSYLQIYYVNKIKQKTVTDDKHPLPLKETRRII